MMKRVERGYFSFHIILYLDFWTNNKVKGEFGWNNLIKLDEQRKNCLLNILELWAVINIGNLLKNEHQIPGCWGINYTALSSCFPFTIILNCLITKIQKAHFSVLIFLHRKAPRELAHTGCIYNDTPNPVQLKVCSLIFSCRLTACVTVCVPVCSHRMALAHVGTGQLRDRVSCFCSD